MKVLIINGSPRANGNTDIALREMEKVFAEEGVETKRLNIGTQMIHGCVACNACHRTGKCGFDDVVNRAADILRDCDGLGRIVFGPAFLLCTVRSHDEGRRLGRRGAPRRDERNV